MYKTLSSITTPGQSRPGCDDTSTLSKTPSSDCLMSYPGYSLGRRVSPFYRDAIGVFFSLSQLGYEIQEEKSLTLKDNIFWECVAAKFNICWTKFFIMFLLTKIKNLYSWYNVSKYKICTVFRTMARTNSLENTANFYRGHSHLQDHIFPGGLEIHICIIIITSRARI